MDAVEQAVRALGRAIQEDSRYRDFQAAKTANDADPSLQEAIRRYHLKEVAYQQEQQRFDDQQDEQALEEMELQVRQAYFDIMQNPHMVAYDAAKQELDEMVQNVESILRLCVMGEDPDTCMPNKNSCSGTCGTCGRCGSCAE